VRRMHSDRLISPWLPHLLPSITSRSFATRAKTKIKEESSKQFLKLGRNARVAPYGEENIPVLILRDFMKIHLLRVSR